MTHVGTQTIQTERLLLRRYSPEDAESMFRNYANDAEVCRFLSWSPYESTESVRETLVRWQEEYRRFDFYHWAIVYSGEVLGGISVVRLDELNQTAELGYCLGRAYWGKGITTEAAKAVINYLFTEVNVHRLSAKHDVLNPASGGVMRHLCMRHEGTFKNYYVRRDGSVSDALNYAILRDEWEGSK